MRNVTQDATVVTPKPKVKSHNFAANIIDFIMSPLVAIASGIGHFFWGFLENGHLIFGAFLMGYSFFLCTENYFKLLNRGNISEAFQGILGSFWIGLSIGVAMLIAGTVEFTQTQGWIAFQTSRAKTKVSGDSNANSLIIAAVIATLCEFVALLYRFWFEGFNFVVFLKMGIALAGFKFGWDWFRSFQVNKLKKANSNYQDLGDIPQP